MCFRSFFLNFLPVLPFLSAAAPPAAFAMVRSQFLFWRRLLPPQQANCRLAGDPGRAARRILLGRLLLAGHRSLARTLAGAGIGVRALSADGQAAAVTVAAIGADFDEPLDVKRDFLAQVAFHLAFVLNHLTDAVHFLFAQVLDLLDRIDGCRRQDLHRARLADAVDISERDPCLLVAGQIDACNTCHIGVLLCGSCLVAQWAELPLRPPGLLALALLMFRVFADDPHHPVAVDHLALVANLFDRSPYLHLPLPGSFSIRSFSIRSFSIRSFSIRSFS